MILLMHLQVINAPNGINVKYIDSRGVTSETEKELKKNKVDVQQDGRPQKGSNPTLDRINL